MMNVARYNLEHSATMNNILDAVEWGHGKYFGANGEDLDSEDALNYYVHSGGSEGSDIGNYAEVYDAMEVLGWLEETEGLWKVPGWGQGLIREPDTYARRSESEYKIRYLISLSDVITMREAAAYLDRGIDEDVVRKMLAEDIDGNLIPALLEGAPATIIPFRIA